jgi:hypothetical protein
MEEEMGMFGIRHYEAIAMVLVEVKLDHLYEGYEALHDLAEKLCELFSGDNPNFDREKFLKTCGMEE